MNPETSEADVVYDSGDRVRRWGLFRMAAGGGGQPLQFLWSNAAVPPHLADRQVYCAWILCDVVVRWWVSTHMTEWLCVWYLVLCLTYGHKATERQNSGSLEYILRSTLHAKLPCFLIRGHTVGSACYVTSKDFLVKKCHVHHDTSGCIIHGFGSSFSRDWTPNCQTLFIIITYFPLLQADQQ